MSESDFKRVFRITPSKFDIKQLNLEFITDCSGKDIYGFNPDLNELRNKIDTVKSDDWKRVRWYINDYDFLVKDPIINRAFYKYWEIINYFEIFQNYENDDIILHSAEAPGGFIQGTNIYLQLNNEHVEKKQQNKIDVDNDGFTVVSKKRNKKVSKIYTISLNKDLPEYKSYNLPSYNKVIINKHIKITYGVDNTGDINNWKNIDHLNYLTSSKQFYFITNDGGFDEGNDFNNKEQLHYMLILSEIYMAIKLQKPGGHFLLKVFDIVTETSIHLLYLLSVCYRDVYVYKPKTSRPTNSEKYVVCNDFCLDNANRIQLLEKLNQFRNKINYQKNSYIVFKIFKEIPVEFANNIKDLNTQLFNVQKHFLERALELSNNQNFLREYDEYIYENINKRKQKFEDWQNEFNLLAYI